MRTFDEQILVGKTVKIIENLEDHIGYNGEDLKIISVNEEEYCIVESENGARWFAGVEELNLFI